MKKRLCLALCIALLLCAAAPAWALTNEDVIGTWYLNEITTGGASIDPSAVGMDTTLENAADGTMTVTNLISGTVAYSWATDGDTLRTALADNPDYTLIYGMREGCLVIEADGMGMVFGRERVVVESYQPGDRVADAQLADFVGEWEAYYMSLQGLVLPFATTGMTVTLAIGEAGATMADTENGETTTLTYMLSFADGTLTLTDANATGHEFGILPLMLLTDGYLCYESEQGNIYFRPLGL